MNGRLKLQTRWLAWSSAAPRLALWPALRAGGLQALQAAVGR
jgi:hypothetical protein